MINLTLLVQIVHFWLAYFILDRIVLRHAVKKVQHEEQTIAAVQQHIATINHEIAQKTEEQAREWQHMQQLLLQQKPSVQPTPLITIKRLLSEEVVPLTKQETAQLAHTIQQLVVEKIVHEERS